MKWVVIVMMSIDSDAHVIETPTTWDYIPEKDIKYKPVVVKLEGTDVRPNGVVLPARQFWAMDGRLVGRERNVGSDTDRASREMSDIQKRLDHMDELKVEIQVLYPSLFLRPITLDPKLELVLIKSYNRWIAEVSRHGNGRLRWVAVAPLLSMHDPAILRDELSFAKEHGACGIFMCGLSVDREMTDPYFHPLFNLAQELDLAICFHAGNASRAVHDFFATSDGFPKFKFPVLTAFNALLLNEIPQKYPALRWGFTETGASWVPYVLSELWRRFKQRGKDFDGQRVLAEGNFYIAAQVNEDIPYLAEKLGEDRLMMATDYGHHDTSTELDAMLKLEDRADLSQQLKQKILRDNAARLYGL